MHLDTWAFKGTIMATETSQKLKPLLIAIGFIAVVAALVIKAPDFVRSLSG
jgi:hypothetical protein